MRVIGLDFGSKTTGIAMSDIGGRIASPVETVFREEEVNLKQTVRRIRQLAQENDVHTIVLGLPKNMNNTVGERAEKALEFGEMLKKRTGLEVIMWDERLTTVSADRTLMEAGVRRENRKEYLDGIAAVFILQGYLDSLKM